MKMVIDGYAGAGCITMGGYDYHGGMRQEGETKDFRAGRCMGACLEYAARMDKPLMMYVFSDGSLSSNGVIDNSVAGRGKGEWTSDNQDTAAPFFLVYNPPRGRPPAAAHEREVDGRAAPAARLLLAGRQRRALGHARREQREPAGPDGLLNYMALHGEQGQFPTLFPNHGLGDPRSSTGSLRSLRSRNGMISFGESTVPLGLSCNGYSAKDGRVAVALLLRFDTPPVCSLAVSHNVTSARVAAVDCDAIMRRGFFAHRLEADPQR